MPYKNEGLVIRMMAAESLERLRWKDEVYFGQISALLEVKDLSDVVLGEEIPKEGLRKSRNETGPRLYKVPSAVGYKLK